MHYTKIYVAKWEEICNAHVNIAMDELARAVKQVCEETIPTSRNLCQQISYVLVLIGFKSLPTLAGLYFLNIEQYIARKRCCSSLDSSSAN
jgi:hypothetical protein